MATKANYYPDISNPSEVEKLLPSRIENLILACEAIRQEVNKIRNTLLANQIPVSRELLSGISHLQVDMAYIRVELAHFLGKPHEEIDAMMEHVHNPWRRGSNEG